MIEMYSQWYFDMGWLLVTAIGAMLAMEFGLIRAYLFIIPAVFFALFWK